jgi:uncharacterized protein
VSPAEQILREARTIAVVGLSTDPAKAAHEIPRQMQAAGYRIVPIHPSAEQILGERAYRTLSEVPQQVDAVNVFRPAAEVCDVVRQAIAIGARGVWIQLGITSAKGRDLAARAGVTYVDDACIGVERRRLGITAGES